MRGGGRKRGGVIDTDTDTDMGDMNRGIDTNMIIGISTAPDLVTRDMVMSPAIDKLLMRTEEMNPMIDTVQNPNLEPSPHFDTEEAHDPVEKVGITTQNPKTHLTTTLSMRWQVVRGQHIQWVTRKEVLLLIQRVVQAGIRLHGGIWRNRNQSYDRGRGRGRGHGRSLVDGGWVCLLVGEIRRLVDLRGCGRSLGLVDVGVDAVLGKGVEDRRHRIQVVIFSIQETIQSIATAPSFVEIRPIHKLAE